QVARAGRRAVGRVRQPVAELRERELLLRVVQAQREARLVQEPPEVVARIREVGCCRGGHAAGVDPAEDTGQTGRENVGDCARWFACHAADSVARAASTSPCTPTSSAAGPPDAGLRSRAGGGGTSRCGSSASCRLHPSLVESLLEEDAQVLTADRRVAD